MDILSILKDVSSPEQFTLISKVLSLLESDDVIYKITNLISDNNTEGLVPKPELFFILDEGLYNALLEKGLTVDEEADTVVMVAFLSGIEQMMDSEEKATYVKLLEDVENDEELFLSTAIASLTSVTALKLEEHIEEVSGALIINLTTVPIVTEDEFVKIRYPERDTLLAHILNHHGYLTLGAKLVNDYASVGKNMDFLVRGDQGISDVFLIYEEELSVIEDLEKIILEHLAFASYINKDIDKVSDFTFKLYAKSSKPTPEELMAFGNMLTKILGEFGYD